MGVQRVSGIVLIAVVAALVSGCAAEPAPEVTPTPTFTSHADAFAAAEATYRAYVDALNQVDLADPETFEAVYAWTTGDANAGIRQSLSHMHAERWTVEGTSVPRTVDPLLFRPDRSELAVCLDVSSVVVRDTAGSSVVSDSRGNVQTMTVVVVPSPETPTGALIAEIKGRSTGPPC